MIRHEALPLNDNQSQAIATRVLDLIKAEVLTDNRFLAPAVGRLKTKFDTGTSSFSTDGAVLFVDAKKLCNVFSSSQSSAKTDYLHTLLHCILLHPFVSTSVHRDYWDLACDIAVECNVLELVDQGDCAKSSKKNDALRSIRKSLNEKPITAESVYKELNSGKHTSRIKTWSKLFSADDHSHWYTQDSSQPKPQNKNDSDPNPDTQNPESVSQGINSEESKGSSKNEDAGSKSIDKNNASKKTSHQTYTTFDSRNREALRKDWEAASRRIAMDLQTYSKQRGTEAGSLLVGIQESSQKKVDYTDFLRQFAVPTEVLKVSDDEFDYIFYTYGLKLYGNLPLIEPLEYSEQKRIREFVIVIDTSGSVSGPIVQRFIQITFGILKETEAFAEQVNVRIIQCDTVIQADDVIHNLRELSEWRRTYQLRGFGGTDFRPAFRYVDKLIEDGEFQNLGGLIYFTDGFGVYPEWTPDYKVAFVFYDEKYDETQVPPWAAQIILDDQALKPKTNSF